VVGRGSCTFPLLPARWQRQLAALQVASLAVDQVAAGGSFDQGQVEARVDADAGSIQWEGLLALVAAAGGHGLQALAVGDHERPWVGGGASRGEAPRHTGWRPKIQQRGEAQAAE